MISVIIPSREPTGRELSAPGIEMLNPHGGHFVENARRGLSLSIGEHILYLNDDAHIAPDDIKALSDYLDAHLDVAIVGPYIFPGASYGHEPSLIGGVFHFLRLPFFAQAQDGNLKEHDVDYVSGACLMARRDYANLSPAFTAFYEDVDLCKRARSLGMRVVYYPGVLVYHLGGLSYKGKQKSELMRGSLRIYLNCWHGRWYSRLTAWLYEHKLLH